MSTDQAAAATPSSRPYRIADLDHISLYLRDLPRAIAFYSQVFGPPAQIDAALGFHGWRMGATWLTLFSDRAGTCPGGNPQNAEFAVRVMAVEEVDALHEALLRAGARACMPPSDTVMYQPMRFCCVDDPFGVRIDVYCPLAGGVA